MNLTDQIRGWLERINLRQQLIGMGCTEIKVDGLCWSFNQPKNGRRWAGGIGAVRNYITSGGYVSRPPRDPVRLSINHVPIWTDQNGG